MNELPLYLQNQLTDLKRRRANVLNAERENNRREAGLASEIREWHVRNAEQEKVASTFKGEQNSHLA